MIKTSQGNGLVGLMQERWLPPKPIYRFHVAPTKILTQFFSESQMKILNFIWIKKILSISKSIISLISDIMNFDP